MAVSNVLLNKIEIALRRMPPERLADVLQFVEFIEYRSQKQTPPSNEASEDEALWAAVQANQAYKAQHPGEMIVHESGADFLADTSED